MYHSAAIAEPHLKHDALIAAGLQLALFIVVAIAGIDHKPPQKVIQVYLVQQASPAPPPPAPAIAETPAPPAPPPVPVQNDTADIGLNTTPEDDTPVTLLAAIPTEDDTARQQEQERKKREKAEAEKAKKAEEEERQRQEAIAAFEAAQERAKTAARESRLDKRMDRDAQKLAGRIINRINDYLKTPATVPRSSDIVVVVHVNLNRDGSLIGIPEIITPSGFPEYDDAAVRAVLQASPLPMPKEDYILRDPDRMRHFLSHNLNITPK